MVKEHKGEPLDSLPAPIPGKAVMPLVEAALRAAPLDGKGHPFVVKR